MEEAAEETPDRVWKSDAKNKLEIARRYALASKEVLSQIETTRTPMARVSAAIDEMSMAIHRIDMAVESEDHSAEREIAEEESKRSWSAELDRRRVEANQRHAELQAAIASAAAIPESIAMLELAVRKMSRSLLTSISAKPRKASVSRTGSTRSSRSGKDRTKGKSSSRSAVRRSRSSKPRASSGRASRRKGG